mgnify:CR=1 FL=1
MVKKTCAELCKKRKRHPAEANEVSFLLRDRL